MDAKPFYGDFLEHAGSVGEMHLSDELALSYGFPLSAYGPSQTLGLALAFVR